MTNIRQVKRVFLASPGDLGEERALIRDVVENVNRYVAPKLGYHVDLLGWEDTLPGHGRPQALINTDVDICDLFIGVLWKRWGSPPDNENKYTSGFEEEYQRAMHRCEASGSPEVCLYLKDIDEELSADPGEGLKKVIEFREMLTSQKRVFYKDFSSPLDIQTYVRNKLDDFLLSEHYKAQQTEPKEKKARSDTTGIKEEAGRALSSPLAEEGHLFLDDFTERLMSDESMDNVNAYDIARFRLLANSISKHGNDESQLGVHDLNILYKEKDKRSLGGRERMALTEFALRKTKTEVVPFWYWLASYDHGSFKILPYFSVGSDNEVMEGALIQMSRSRVPISDDSLVDRRYFINSWLSEDADENVKRAALAYLRDNGEPGDIEAIRAEFELANSSTQEQALGSLIGIMVRNGATDIAEQFANVIRDNSISSDLLEYVIDQLETLPPDKLIEILNTCKSTKVRKSALTLAVDHGVLEAGLLEKLVNDADSDVRYAALLAKNEIEGQVSMDEAKRILVKRKAQYRGGLFSAFTASEEEGKENLERYEFNCLLDNPISALEKMKNNAGYNDDEAYFALGKKGFNKYASTLRKDVDDRFKSYTEEKLNELRRQFAESDENKLVERAEKVSEFYRRQLTRRALDLLCEKAQKRDLPRIRKNLETRFTNATIMDAHFLLKQGTFADIDRIVKADGPTTQNRTILSSQSDRPYDFAVADCVSKLGRSSVSKLLSKNLPPRILEKVILAIPNTRFKAIENPVLLKLLHNSVDRVRKAAAVKAIISLPISRTRPLLEEYLEQASHYYNVVHWLDAGVFLPRAAAKTIGKSELANY